ncbi:helix-turn-helix domain-containing protein [Paenibacillus prosopidis]|uniref:AraC family transcriptional regulator of arabinose operon n=1 Tax=Paenibacillus prosopidis TaxID=630520 RepID=A0A368W6W2_9BACL|nr:AraC family transcriptional regulator [Paenibacillus prosopidis]RCW48013.1 AraC family transcriptional regulator of arabinose operon [Paenibacillus prosopidis]
MIAITDMHQDNGGDWYEEGLGRKVAFHLVLVTYGKCVYWVNHEKIILEKGDLLLIPGHIPYYGKSIPTVVHTKFVVNFRKTAADSRLPILHLHEPFKQRLGCYEIIHERLRGMLHQWKERPAYYEIMAEALLTEALVLLNQERDRGVISSEKHRRVDSMKQYIQTHYREKVTKEELGDVIMTTPNYAATLFKTVTSQTISGYVHNVRMKTAVYMLTESQLTVTEISDYLGYNDVSYFHRVFKRSTGRAPSDFLHERSSTNG